MYLIKLLFPVFLLKQIHYRHRKQGEKEDDYGAKGDDYPLDDLDDGGEGRVGSLHVALGKIQAAWCQDYQIVDLSDYWDVGDNIHWTYAI